MFVHKALIDAISSRDFVTESGHLSTKVRNEKLIAEEFQVCLVVSKCVLFIAILIES